MNDPTTILPGPLDRLVLRTLRLGSQHGHGIATAIERASEDLLADHGSLYSALQRLERAGMISSEWGVSGSNRGARYYRLTRRGRGALMTETGPWESTRRSSRYAWGVSCSSRVVSAPLHPTLTSSGFTFAPEGRDGRREIVRITAMAVMAGGIVPGATADWNPERTVTVCMERGEDSVVRFRAQSVASKMFAAIGVTILWRTPYHCPAQAIQITVSEATPPTLFPGALAYARPYEGTHIRVFYDRIRQMYERKEVDWRVLAHVLVHEITHVLQGVNRHSDMGVMKAQWDGGDFSYMEWKPLPFTMVDLYLIYHGLAERATRTVFDAAR